MRHLRTESGPRRWTVRVALTAVAPGRGHRRRGDTVAPRPAVLVAVHYCTGSGPALHNGTEFANLANQYRFIIVYPSATRSGQCFDVSSPGALRRNGNSGPVSIVSMVNYVLSNYNADPARVFVAGVSYLTVTNTGSVGINGWSLVFTLPSGQTITSGWNATDSPTSGQVTARDLSYNASIPPGLDRHRIPGHAHR